MLRIAACHFAAQFEHHVPAQPTKAQVTCSVKCIRAACHCLQHRLSSMYQQYSNLPRLQCQVSRSYQFNRIRATCHVRRTWSSKHLLHLTAETLHVCNRLSMLPPTPFLLPVVNPVILSHCSPFSPSLHYWDALPALTPPSAVSSLPPASQWLTPAPTISPFHTLRVRAPTSVSPATLPCIGQRQRAMRPP